MSVASIYFSKTCQDFRDQAQIDAITHMEHLYHRLCKEHNFRRYSLQLRQKLVPGLYLWGDVGIGKTFLIDCLYDALPFKEKGRMHFFVFMQMIHEQLKLTPAQKNPLERIVKKLAKKYQVIFLDEFMVTDIVDAMLLKNLLTALFKEKICLVTTSNTPPDHLYEKGLQRALFLPAIDLLKTNLQVIHLASKQDYRTMHKGHDHEHSSDFFNTQAKGHISHEPISINGRLIKVRQRTEHMVWFDYAAICKTARSQYDYLVLAQKFNTIIIDHIPAIEAHEKDTIKRFIRMIDVFYDAKINFYFTTLVPIEKIYTANEFYKEFKRCKSRLIEMQRNIQQMSA